MSSLTVKQDSVYLESDKIFSLKVYLFLSCKHQTANHLCRSGVVLAVLQISLKSNFVYLILLFNLYTSTGIMNKNIGSRNG